MKPSSWVYILTNSRKNVLYIGVTSNIEKRLYEHRQGTHEDSFSKKYNVIILVHIEEYPSIQEAIEREKQLKNWKRSWKDTLIETNNPLWTDLTTVIERS